MFDDCTRINIISRRFYLATPLQSVVYVVGQYFIVFIPIHHTYEPTAC